MSLPFYIAHATSGRTRIKWAGDRNNRASVIKVAGHIAAIEGVDQAIPRLSTGSIVVEHEQTEWSSLEPEITSRLSLTFSTPVHRPRTGADTINLGIDQVNGALKKIKPDLGSVTLLLLLILIVAQTWRGQVLSASGSYLWYALNIAMMARNKAATQQEPALDDPE